MFGIAFSSAPIGSAYSDASGNCRPLGKKFTCGQIEDLVRAETGTENEKYLTSAMFLDWINWACDDLKERLQIWRRFVCWKRLGTGTSLSLSGVKMRGILKVVDSASGVVKMVSPTEFEQTNSFTAYNSSVIGTQEGDVLRLDYGSSTTRGHVTLYYFRHIIPATRRSHYPDLPDEFVQNLISAVTENVKEWKDGLTQLRQP